MVVDEDGKMDVGSDHCELEMLMDVMGAEKTANSEVRKWMAG